jgi:hypothetical protein
MPGPGPRSANALSRIFFYFSKIHRLMGRGVTLAVFAKQPV